MIVSEYFFTVSPAMRNGSRELFIDAIENAIGHAISKLANSLDWQVINEPTFRFRELAISDLPDDGEVVIILIASRKKHINNDTWSYYYQIFPKSETLCKIPLCEGSITVRFEPCLVPAG